jgi:DNA-directed RNA polymerase specialized sigma24 family protein
VKITAQRIRTTERDDLESELARRLLQLKRYPPSRVRNWDAFVAMVLRHKAANWIRDRQTREVRMVALDESREQDDGAILALEDVLTSPEPDKDLCIDFARLWDGLDPELQTAWTMLGEENGNQSNVARRLGRHRNTIRSWVRKIRQSINAHGLGLSHHTDESAIKPARVFSGRAQEHAKKQR